VIDITHKPTTLREATAQAIVRLSAQATMDAVQARTVPKGDVFEMARAAGLLGVKRTPDLLPDCHPIPIEEARVGYRTEGLDIVIEMHVRAIYRTGVEVEAMHGASVVALTMYDMLKPIDKDIEILHIRLLEKKGGKSSFMDKFRKDLRATVVVCSDTIAAGQKEDKAGGAIARRLKEMGVSVGGPVVIPDEMDRIQAEVRRAVEGRMDLLVYTGGTGLSVRDVTPEALRPLLDREIPGVAEAIRAHGQQRTPYSMLSRCVAGMVGRTMVLALPGSTRGAVESMDAVFPALLHAFLIMGGARH
jgi:cyclic pyranopterin monophosphate synthase